MDATSFVALSTALDISLPSALEDALQQLERARMEREDPAARGIQGRFAANCSFVQDVSGRYWIQSFHSVCDMHLESVRNHRANLREVQRMVSTATTDATIATAVDQMLEDVGSFGEETDSDDEDDDDDDDEDDDDQDAEMADA